tara:strand:- start:192 stop:605 length:414 start_codon:yes stop_codon:yes gene_type:complete
MPLKNWIKCNEGDLRFARKKIQPKDKEIKTDSENWVLIYDGYIEKFGLGELFKKMLETKRKKALLECEFIETWEQFKITEINIEVQKLNNMMRNNGDGMTIEQSLIYLSKWLGFHLNTKKITVTEYFNLMAEYGKGN